MYRFIFSVSILVIISVSILVIMGTLLTGCGKQLPVKDAGTSCRGYSVGARAVDGGGNPLKCTFTSTGSKWLIPEG